MSKVNYINVYRENPFDGLLRSMLRGNFIDAGKLSTKRPRTNTVRTGSRWILSKTKDNRLVLIFCNDVTGSQLLRGLCGVLWGLSREGEMLTLCILQIKDSLIFKGVDDNKKYLTFNSTWLFSEPSDLSPSLEIYATADGIYIGPHFILFPLFGKDLNLS